eukprot:1147670-Pelagomonas_calceolata.AAC.1
MGSSSSSSSSEEESDEEASDGSKEAWRGEHGEGSMERAVMVDAQKTRQEEKTMQALRTLPTSIKEKGIPRAEALCTSLTKENKKKKPMGVRRFTKDAQL